MPKAEKGTPKDIANKIKAKGLQKLKHYCEMCKKQCRDENGFKCHLLTEGHKRMMNIYAENADDFLDAFSKEFEKTFMDLLKRRFGTRRVKATTVYNEFIHDRDHTHMNATIWETLTDFVKYLGKSGLCTVDQTEEGWFIRYIDRDPEAIRRQMEAEKKEKMEMDDEERTAKFIEKQIQRAQEQAALKGDAPKESAAPSELLRDPLDAAESERLKFSLAPTARSAAAASATHSGPAAPLSVLLKQTASHSHGTSSDLPAANPLDDQGAGKAAAAPALVFKTNTAAPSSAHHHHHSSNGSLQTKRKISALEEIMAMEEKAKQKQARLDYWLFPGLVVRIIIKSLQDGFYYKRKGVVLKVTDKYIADVKIQELGDVLRLDQEHLETVLPSLDQQVFVVNGLYRGCVARLQSLETEKYMGRVRLESGPSAGKTVELPYEDICKFEGDAPKLSAK